MSNFAQWPAIQRAFFWMGLSLMILFVLVVGKNLLIPFVISVFVWYLINALSNRIESFSIGGKHVPRWLALTIAIVVLLVFVESVIDILVTNIISLSKQAPLIEQKVNAELNVLLASTGIGKTPSGNEIGAILNFGTTFLTGLARSLGDTAGKTVTIFLYVAFLLAEQGTFNRKLAKIIPDADQLANTLTTLEVIGGKVRSYLLVKTIASLTSAVLSYFVLIAVGVNLAPLWALLVFLLNFVPYVGSVLSMLFPTVIALVQFETPQEALIVAGGLAGASILVANLLEPRLMGQSLNLSPLLIIISLALWGTLWGIGGMIIAIPITVMLMIVFSQFPETRTVAILLSQKGDIEVVNKKTPIVKPEGNPSS